MFEVVELAGAVEAADRDAVLTELELVEFERHRVGRSGQPRATASLHSEGLASTLCRSLADRLGRPSDWPVSPMLHDLTPSLERCVFSGVSTRFRVYEYQRGDSFALHRDEERAYGPRCWSALSLLLYLPGTRGGETWVEGTRIVPTPWTCVAFAHYSWHLSAEIEAGVKRVARGDVLISTS